MGGTPPFMVVVSHKNYTTSSGCKTDKVVLNKHTNETLILTQEFGWRIRSMTEQQAARYISQLTHEEKLILDEMLIGLEQMRRPSPSRPASTEQDA